MEKKENLVLRTYKRGEVEFPPPGQPILRSRYQGNFVAFCSASDCLHSHELEGGLPFWAEDCPVVLDILRCPECGSPAVRPPHLEGD